MYFIIALFCLLQIIFVPIFIKSGWPKTKKSTLLIKMICSTVFVGFAAFNIYISGADFGGTYQRFILIALALGWVGDVFLTADPFLEGKSKEFKLAVNIVGACAFLAGHIFFIIAFFKKTKEIGAALGITFFVPLAVVLVALVLAKMLLKVKLSKLAVPVAIYALMIDVMFSAAFNLGISVGSWQSVLTLGVGTLLFVASDFSLGIKYFDDKRFNTLTVRSVYITAYYIAQMLIAASLLVIK
ncbi:MAG: lysoplasmalogenase [Clostridia bacterium]|nr:lysoplasmalogenase [Clostridia bacterium]